MCHIKRETRTPDIERSVGKLHMLGSEAECFRDPRLFLAACSRVFAVESRFLEPVFVSLG